MQQDYKKNPNWKRPKDWHYEEDWNSPAWKERIEKTYQKIKEKRQQFGFEVCPECKTQHTAKTLCCRECEYKVQI